MKSVKNVKLKVIVPAVVIIGAMFAIGAAKALKLMLVTPQIDVCSYDRGVDCPITESTTITAPRDGVYAVHGIVGRGTIDNECQAHEDFNVLVNGKLFATSKDPNPCEPGTENIYIEEQYGNVNLNGGANNITVSHAYTNSPTSAESVSVRLFFTRLYPEIQIDKNDNDNGDDNQTVNQGNEATFKIRVTNTGDAILKNVSLDDAQAPRCAIDFPEDLFPGDYFDPGESFEYTCSDENIQESYTNTISVNAMSLADEPVSDSDTSKVNVVKPGEISVDIVKDDNDNKDDEQTVNQGENATFSMVITNNGEEPLHQVVITDEQAPNCNRTASATKNLYNGEIFDPGESFTYTCTDENIQEAYTNTVRVMGFSEIWDTAVTDFDNSDVEVVLAYCGDGKVNNDEECDDGNNEDGDGCSATCNTEKASIKIDKNDNDNGDDNQTVNQGDDASFEITITNNGEVDLEDVVVTDTEAPGCARSASQTADMYSGGLFNPEENFSYTCSDSDVQSDYINTAEVSADPTDGSDSVDDSDDSEVKVILPYCGDGNIDFGETCDDGNNIDGDGCSATCTIETIDPYCGDGNVDVGEACDDGNNLNGDGCSATCTTEIIEEPYCGDGNIDSGETCDDGNNEDGDGCSATCSVEKTEKKCKGTIGNYVWNDANGDGIQDKSEKGLKGIRVKLVRKANNKTYKTKTNSKGKYEFDGLCAGEYKVIVKDENVSSYTQTYDPDKTMNNKTDVKLKGRKDNHTKADFGYIGKVAPATGSGNTAFIFAALSSIVAVSTYKQVKNKKAYLKG